MTDDRERVHHSRCGGRPDAPRDGLQEKRKGRHRAPKLSETRVHSFVGPFGTTHAAASDKFPKKRSGPCVLVGDPLSLTSSSLESLKTMRLSRYFLPVMRETPKE
ncbi:MAG: hypothetical protein WA729_05540, partial [Pseudolabrys sp.]